MTATETASTHVTTSTESSTANPTTEMITTMGSMSMSSTETDSGMSASESAATTSTTDLVPNCGDGILDPGEDCDDGNDKNDDACVKGCEVASCGDSYIQADVEQCDDGNDDNTDFCVKGCAVYTCGDGYLKKDIEICDDGPLNGKYGKCADTCKGPGPHCGDGKRDPEFEECDDGNKQDEADECSDTCFASRTVFVTRNVFLGDMSKLDETESGIALADFRCESAANNANGLITAPKNVKWFAWLSDSKTSPSMRMNTSYTGYYKRVDGATIAHGWADLTDGSLEVSISVTEQNEQLIPGAKKDVWSNTADNGDAIENGSHCSDWTDSMTDGLMGASGLADSATGTWTKSSTFLCGFSLRLYCFQDSILDP